MHPAIAQHRAAIAEICRRHGIGRLEVVGSAARAVDFRAESSDVDFLVQFAPDASADFDTYFGAKAELERLLGRSVDLIETDAVRNPFILASLNRHRETVYAP